MTIEISATLREDMGKGASRRLRREAKMPAILYGAGKDPVNLTLTQKDILRHLENEAFYTQVISLDVEGEKVDVVLRDLQRHPYRIDILHADFQRIDANKVLHVSIPLHFEGEDQAPGVKTEGGAVSHLMTEVEVECLPGAIPEYITVDISGMHTNDILHLSDLKMPEGVIVYALKHGDDHDEAVVSIHARKGGDDDEAATEEGGEAAEGEQEEGES